MLSAVAQRCDKRSLDDVWEHDPTHDASRTLLRRLQTAWHTRRVPLFGGTTEGAALSPQPIGEVCGDGPHQLCTLHSVAEVGHAG
jgi:hypothetical protein